MGQVLATTEVVLVRLLLSYLPNELRTVVKNSAPGIAIPRIISILAISGSDNSRRSVECITFRPAGSKYDPFS